jgi:hypothetical protein
VADDGVDVDDPTAATILDDAASSMLEKESRNKTEPRILVFRRKAWYYNSVWAIG